MNSYYLIGERLGHSLSPALHRAFGRYDYALRELAPAELEPFLRRRGFAGLNVTIPYKQAVIPYLDRLDPQAAAIGAVNTVVNRDGTLWGYNTDHGGMCAALSRLGLSPAGKTVLILGTGGTARTALAVCRSLGAAEAVCVSRTGRNGALTCAEAAARFDHAQLLIQCTPVGMSPDMEGLPIDLSAFPRLRGVFDCVYNPPRTRLVLEAEVRGLPAGGGLEMLVRQAALSCALFTGTPVPEGSADVLCGRLRRGQENLVLIGMPGAGKTTVGRLLAQMTGRTFTDLDEALEQQTGTRIRTIFAERGEAYFRELETELVRTLAQTGGQVLATGGGTVLRAENVRRLRQTGRLFFLDRPLEALRPAADRPLGDTAEKVAALYAARRPIYAAAADHRIDSVDSPEQAAQAVWNAFAPEDRRELT